MSKSRWVVCLSNTGFEASLELRKLYEAFADADAERHEQLRIVDESGEDYLYPAAFFAEAALSAALIKRLRKAA